MFSLRRIGRALRRPLKRTVDAVIGGLGISALQLVSRADPDRMADAAAWLTRTIGPLLSEHRVARENLIAAFPAKSAAEIEAILRGSWDNLGRIGAEFAHLHRLWDFNSEHPEQHGRIEITPENIERFNQLLHDGKPALIFAAHLANWELPAIAAATYKLDSAVLYRRPNIPGINKWLRETRTATMGELIATGFNAPVKIAEALRRGAHVGILVDQYYLHGVEVTFFGRRTMANPLLARLARHFDCPIHGTRIIRLPGHRFRAELTDAIAPARDAEGMIDIAGTMQIVTDVVESWVREYPEQWLWQHRRWRPEDMKTA
jgi:KDO2-lipid IV(A) lauroyltransferase